ncbi:MAG: hypothetical protein WA323_18820 [Candidatus Nitrosopolaris sp.]|jgi:uncharacterized membrane protein YcfT
MSAAATELYSKYDNNDFWISRVSILTGLPVFIPLFAFLFYMDNKLKYRDSTSGKANHTFRNLLIKKLLALYSISNTVNIVARFIIIYELL